MEDRMASVLLVDDVADALAPLAKMLKDGGHDVAYVRNGLEALEALDDVTPDVVVTDIRMPVMDGMAFLRAVERSPSHRGRVAVILMSGEDGAGDLAFGRRLGAKAVFVKGRMSADALLGAIEYWSGN
jgi:CheY-like chemotaxis protein